MQWYSVKNYKPITGVQLFLLTDENVIEVGHYLKGEYLYLDNIRITNITYFCIPDPVEIEHD